MAKKATDKSSAKGSGSKASDDGTSIARTQTASEEGRASGSESGFNPGEAFIKLLQSPLVAELVAVAATAALAALAEHGFTTGSEAKRGKRAGKAVKEAGKAAAAAVGRRLGTEIDEIRKAATSSTAGAGA